MRNSLFNCRMDKLIAEDVYRANGTHLRVVAATTDLNPLKQYYSSLAALQVVFKLFRLL